MQPPVVEAVNKLKPESIITSKSAIETVLIKLRTNNGRAHCVHFLRLPTTQITLFKVILFYDHLPPKNDVNEMKGTRGLIKKMLAELFNVISFQLIDC